MKLVTLKEFHEKPGSTYKSRRRLRFTLGQRPPAEFHMICPSATPILQTCSLHFSIIDHAIVSHFCSIVRNIAMRDTEVSISRPITWNTQWRLTILPDPEYRKPRQLSFCSTLRSFRFCVTTILVFTCIGFPIGFKPQTRSLQARHLPAAGSARKRPRHGWRNLRFRA